MSEAPVHVVPYDPSWIDKFESEKTFLEPLLAPWRKGPIEHVGSTAVVGLCAKPVIDIMVGVTSLSESEPAKDILRQSGYQYAEYKTNVMHWFCKPSFAMRTHHLHLVPFESPLWNERLAFRDLKLFWSCLSFQEPIITSGTSPRSTRGNSLRLSYAANSIWA